MAEVQTTTESGETAQRFIEMVMMMAQNAAFALGQIPHPETGEAPVNLELARIFIDQLILLRSKTRGNLTQEELGILNNTISNLQMVFFEIAQGGGAAAESEAAESDAGPAAGAVEAGPAEAEAAGEAKPAGEAAPAEGEGESRKKFTKSYGA